MPIALILIGSIGWFANVVIAFQSVGIGNVASVNGHTSSALAFLWLLFGGLVWQFYKK